MLNVKVIFRIVFVPVWLLCGVTSPIMACGQVEPVDRNQPCRADSIISSLNLQAHREGGYFRRTFQSDHRPMLQTSNGARFTLTSIYYLLTRERPIGHFHMNKSDIIHFFHEGDPIDYFLISPQGEVVNFTLGRDFQHGQVYQYTVPGGWWKASRLAATDHGYGLISEAVSPGFDYKDMRLAEAAELVKKFPQHKRLIEAMSFTKVN